ncbi:MAG: Ni/Fe hydrogenase subunit alpha [Bacilli bacterium]
MNKKVDVHHVTRVEGHGNIVVNVQSGVIEQVEWQVPEAPRFFEAMVRGRSWEDLQTIVSRICGICSISHSLACIKGIESAMGIPVSDQTDKLRLLAHYSEQVQSHVLHVGYLVAPDMLGAKSVVPLVQTHFDVVKTVIQLHRMANGWSDLLAGRTTHPITFKPGGFSKIPGETELRALRATLADAIPDLSSLVDVLASLADLLPDFRRETEYVALVQPDRYTFYEGQIGSTDMAEPTPLCEFESVVNEYVSPQSTAKWARWHRDSYAVGALARYNLNSAYLKPLAKDIARTFDLENRRHNPYFNTLAQVVECAHIVESAVELIDDLLTAGLRQEIPHVEPQAGEGVGCVEAPRGILFHRYAFDEQGRCTSANMSIPTNQNHGNIQRDMEVLLPQIVERSEEEIRLWLEMLVRAYDPCISCSTHYLHVEFV